MAGRIFYVDPLHGSSANNGLTSAAYAVGNTGPFGSITDVLWDGDSDPDKFGGSGDIYYMVASTGDYVSTGSYNNYRFDTSPANARWGYNVYNGYIETNFDGYGHLIMIGVNEDLEEDGTRYQIQWDASASNGHRMFTGYFYPFVWRNIEVKSVDSTNAGYMYYWTSGSDGPYFINCKFDWSTPSLSTTLFLYTNPSSSFKQCEFIGNGGGTALRIGAQYGQHCHVVGCKFRDWDIPYRFEGGSQPFYGNIIKDCGYGVYYGSGATTLHVIMNNLFYNITNDAIYLGNSSYCPQIMHNLIVDCGGYAFNSGSSWVPNNDRFFRIARNVVQNATSGVYGTDLISSAGGIYFGSTGDGLYANIEDNVEITGLTLSVDDNFNVTISGFPESYLGITGFGSQAPSSAGGFFSSGVSGESVGGVEEPEQARVTS